MATQNEIKLKILVKSIHPGTVVLASWLKELGISGDLQKHYVHSGWLQSVGRGAFKKPDDTIQWTGGVYAIQFQTHLEAHVGAITALSLQGFSHYFRLNKEALYLFSPYGEKLPKWFTDYKWESQVSHQQTSIFPLKLGIIEMEVDKIKVKVSAPERAILECLYLTPKHIDIMECYHLMEGLVNLKPRLVQEQLEKCNSVKVKRLFLYMAEKAGHTWMNFVNTSEIDLGNGNRQINNGGVYILKYQITVPKELAEL
jgi:hypothetical protein